MDPDSNLEEQRRLYKKLLNGQCSGWPRGRLEADAFRLAELAEALDVWIQNGGFLPKRWAR